MRWLCLLAPLGGGIIFLLFAWASDQQNGDTK